VLTPAISVLSAVEGLHIGTDIFDPYVVPLAVGVLLALFALQSRGTAAVGRLFGPVTLAWFFAIGAFGLYGIVQAPAVLAALNPLHALAFLTGHGRLQTSGTDRWAGMVAPCAAEHQRRVKSGGVSCNERRKDSDSLRRYVAGASLPQRSAITESAACRLCRSPVTA